MTSSGLPKYEQAILKILNFKVIFQCLKLVESFQKNFREEYLIRRPYSSDIFFWKLQFLKYILYFLKMCPIFVNPLHNFGKSEDDIIW